MDESAGCVLALLGIIGLAAFLLTDQWHSAWRYAWSYGIDSSHVSIEKKPDDCNFLKAPIGEKDCHYERVVSTVEISMSTSHSPIESFDGGKTWSEYTPDPGTTVPPYPAVINVTVTWDKVQE